MYQIIQLTKYFLRDVGYIPFTNCCCSTYPTGTRPEILHVIPKGTRPEIVHATINSSCLWNYCEVLSLTKNMRLLNDASDADIEEKRRFSEWVLSIGDKRCGEEYEVDKTIVVPSDLLI